jgi:3'-phosphoadenosine 5'-phosphosulfate sulfotransferase (PAPS reductase)/FAD synthetase
VFVNTGLEYPEIQKFVKDVKDGVYDCFNSDVKIISPEIRFDEVLKVHGYPVISKSVSHSVKVAKRNPEGAVMKNSFNPEQKGRFAMHKWRYLLEAPFELSENCCDEMKKKPAKKYSKQTRRKPIIGTLAVESSMRYSDWLQHGCNAFEQKEPSSQPLSFWTEQDILHYIKKYNIPYCPVYGDIVVDDNAEIEGQTSLFDFTDDYEETDKLKTTGCKRTGCIFCMFGCHLEKGENRFQSLKKTHPKQYEYCIGGGEYNEKGQWQPNEEGLGLAKVLDYIGVDYE